MNIGQSIRDARTQRGMTQRELAGSHFTRELISQIESGRCQPSLKTLTILAQRLGQTIQDFIPASDSEDPIDVQALLSVVDQCLQANLVDAAILCAKEALRACAMGTDGLTIAQACFYLGRSHLALRDWIPACTLFERSLSEFARLGQKKWVIETHFYLGHATYGHQDYRRAVSHYESACEFSADHKSYQTIALRSWLYLGTSRFYIGAVAGSLEAFQKAENLAQQLGDSHIRGEALLGLGWSLHVLGKTKEALETTNRTLQMKPAPSPSLRTNLQHNKGIYLADLGRWQDAFALWTACVEYHRQTGQTTEMASICGDIALFWIHQREFDRAEAKYEEALDLLGENDAAVIRGHLYRGLGYLAHIQERSGRASELYEMSMGFFRLAGATEEIANTRAIMTSSHGLHLLLR